MRRWIVLGALGLLAAPAAARALDEPRPSGPAGSEASLGTCVTTQHQERLERYVFDAAGQRADLDRICAGGMPTSVEIRRRGDDVAAAIFTLGWYTPAHVRVTCTTPR
jgi:hypothetical protein